MEKVFDEFKIQYKKQNVEGILAQRAVKTTIQILYDKGLFDNYANADKVLEAFLFTSRREVIYQKIIHKYNYTSNNIYVYLHLYECL